MTTFLSRITDLKDSFFGQRPEDGAPAEPGSQSPAPTDQAPAQPPAAAAPAVQPLPPLPEEIDVEEEVDGEPPESIAIPGPEEVSFEEGKREYSGMPGNYQVVIRPVYNHLFLSRKYGMQGKPSIKMSWRFNQFGRIDLVDARMLPEKDVHHLMKVRHFEQLGQPWENAVAFYYRLPPRVSLLNPGFMQLSYPRKYQSILRFGHSMARDVIASLERHGVRDSYVLGEQQLQLREIVKDDTALCLLQQASRILPTIKVLNRTVIKLFYAQHES
jgi:hypothetical protein